MKNQLVSTDSFAVSAKNTVNILPHSWREKTTLLLHGPQSVDKTYVALEMARYISDQGRKIAYINAADTLYSHTDQLAGISRMSILTPAFESADDKTDYADLVISAIEEVIAETDIRVFIIDSVTRIAALSFGRNASAAYVMKRLVNLQMRSGCSFLIISDDTTKSTDRTLTTLANEHISAPTDPTDEPTEESLPDQTVAETAPRPATNIPRNQLSRRDRRLLRRANQKSNRSAE